MYKIVVLVVKVEMEMEAAHQAIQSLLSIFPTRMIADHSLNVPGAFHHQLAARLDNIGASAIIGAIGQSKSILQQFNGLIFNTCDLFL